MENSAVPTEIVIDTDHISGEILPGFSPVPSYVEPSMELFYTDIFTLKIPAILTGTKQVEKEEINRTVDLKDLDQSGQDACSTGKR